MFRQFAFRERQNPLGSRKRRCKEAQEGGWIILLICTCFGDPSDQHENTKVYHLLFFEYSVKLLKPFQVSFSDVCRQDTTIWLWGVWWFLLAHRMALKPGYMTSWPPVFTSFTTFSLSGLSTVNCETKNHGNRAKKLQQIHISTFMVDFSNIAIQVFQHFLQLQ